MDIMLIQYGAPPEHKTEEATSRFFSLIFNHLVKQFSFMLRNKPETIFDGLFCTQGRIEYFFKTFGAVAVLCIEMKLKVGNDDERLKIVAQVIAECDDKPRCDLENSTRDFSLPIHCIFTDGLTYEFFKFERNPNPSFIRGCFFGDPVHLRRGLKVPDYSSMMTTLPFILQLRYACETNFDIMLSAYIAGLKAYYVRSEERGKKQGSKGPSLDDGIRHFSRLTVRWQHLGWLRFSARMVILILRMRPLIKLFLRYRRVQEQCRLYTDLASS